MLNTVEKSSNFESLLFLWLVWGILGGAILLIIILKTRKHRHSSRDVPSEPDIDAMSGQMFEAYLADIFTYLGYRVSLTRTTGDYGADLILERDQHRIVVQAKRYTSTVSGKAIQEVVAAKPMYQCTRALVTNSASG